MKKSIDQEIMDLKRTRDDLHAANNDLVEKNRALKRHNERMSWETENLTIQLLKRDSAAFDLLSHLERQRAFSERAFGPSSFKNHIGPLNHLKKEIQEALDEPEDHLEWADIILLGFDAAMRAGHTPLDICTAIGVKQGINERRDWPDWRGTDPDNPIEHIREDERGAE